MSTDARTRFVAINTGAYAAMAFAWIFFSDNLLSTVMDIRSIVWLPTAKDVFFVLVTSAGLYLLLRSATDMDRSTGHRHLDMLAAGLLDHKQAWWAAYGFALALTLSTLMLRDTLGVEFRERPMMILFVLPIALSALFGGLWPGLLSTAVAAGGINYLAVAPVNSWTIASTTDLVQWVILITLGVLISLLSEEMRRTYARAAVSRRLLEAVVSGTPDLISVRDRHGRYLLVNDAAAGVLGRPAAQAIGQPVHELLAPETAGHALAGDARTMANGAVQTREEQLRINGRPHVFLVTRGPVADSGGQVMGAFSVARDITAMRQAQDELEASHDELQRLLAAMDAVQEGERQRMARELHDDLQQKLAAIRIDVGGLFQRPDLDAQSVESVLAEVDRLAVSAIESTRRIINDLRPQMLEDLGLVPALDLLVSQFGRRTGIDCRLVASPEAIGHVVESPEVGTCLFRVTQECLNNVAKHSGAGHVEVGLAAASDGGLLLSVRDDGRGFEAEGAAKPGSFGLIGMRERTRAVGGSCRVESDPGRGTAVEVLIPAMQR
ncbi:PAS domain-containing protein [Rhizobacter sp. LjRoot28]|uniref:PAS domain-containing protein n=1 Tax=Rhizobacter sp. LjRoot28 TaxID=3342309 RepID=UPI003ECC247B